MNERKVTKHMTYFCKTHNGLSYTRSSLLS